MFSRLHIVSCAAAVVLAGSGWAQMQPPGQMQQPPSGVPSGPPQTNMPGTVGSAPDTQVDPYMVDKDFIRNAVEASATELHLGKLAQDKASSDAVKDLGKRMVEANTQTSDQLQKAASALKIQVPADPPRKAKKAEDKLAKLSSADFDRAYAKMAADEQKQTVKEFEREAKNGKVPGVKDFAAKNLPAEQERQKQAEELAGGGTATVTQK